MNPFSSAMKQLDRAAKAGSISDTVVERLRKPNRIVETTFPVVMDSGEEKMFTGFRVQYNNVRGPYKGGIRFHQHVDQNEVMALAFWMTIKTAVVNIPMGGGKGGVTVNPKELSKTELEKLSRGFVRSMQNVIGPHIDVPAPDVYTTPEIMQWMAEEYIALTEDPEGKAVVTGKPISFGGSEGRGSATAQGGFYVLDEFRERTKLLPEAATVAIQGFGNAGSIFASLAYEAGYRVIAVSDSRGAIYNKDGLDIPAVQEHKEKTGSVTGFSGGQNIETLENILYLAVDVLIPAALENQITGENVDRVQAKVILELANGPLNESADAALHNRGVVVIPDVLANAGGVTVSYFEWDQNIKNETWSAAEVDEKLKPIMKEAFLEMHKASEGYTTDYRTAAFIVALKRIESSTQ